MKRPGTYSTYILTSVAERAREPEALSVSPLQLLSVWALISNVSVGQLSSTVANAWSSRLPDKNALLWVQVWRLSLCLPGPVALELWSGSISWQSKNR